MKKLLSLCLAVVMMVSLLACFTVNAATNEYYTLRRENFGIVQNQANSTGWTTQNIGGDVQNHGGFRLNPSAVDYSYGTLAVAKVANVPITASFYVDTPGTYTAFMHVEQNGAGFKFAIDGQETTALFGSTLNETGNSVMSHYLVTEKADRTWTLAEGWHTVTVTAPGGAGRFETIYITNDTALTAAGLTYVSHNTNGIVDSKVNMAAYEDFTAPSAGTLVATPDANVANEQRTSATLTWSGATDASDIAKYEVHNGAEYVDVTNVASYTVNDLWSAADYTFKLRVTDYFGYTAETTATTRTNGSPDTDGPQWPAEAAIIVANASFGSTITWPAATDNRDVAGYEIYEDAVDASNLIASVDAGTTSYTISLNPGETKDIVLVAKDMGGLLSSELTETVASTAGAEGYTIRMENFDMPDASLRLWDLQNISSAMTEAGCIVLNKYPSTPYSRGNAMVGKSAGAEVSAEVWVDTAGEYTLFAQMESGSQVKAALNGQKTTGYLSPYTVGTPTYDWVKADRTWNLEAGWNTLTLSTEDGSGRIAALFLTSSVNIEPTELTYVYANDELIIDGKLNVAQYEDTEGAEFTSGNIDVAYDSTTNAATITWPAATDNAVTAAGSTHVMTPSGLQAYKIYVGDKEIGEVDNATTTFTIDSTSLGRELVPGETIAIEVEALDAYGNETSITLSYEVSKFVISSFAITGTTATLVIKNVSDTPEDVRLSIAIYDATGDLVVGDYTVHTVDADGVNDTVTATITTGAPADMTGYTVKAHLWNPGDLTPVSANWPTIVQ